MKKGNTRSMKECTKCKEVKVLDDFHFNKLFKSGRNSFCKECNRIRSKEWKIKNPHLIKIYTRNQIERSKLRYNNDELFRVKTVIRSIIYRSLKDRGYKKGSRTHEILGCSFEDFKIYLESKFESWMSWNNHGKYNGELNYGWEVDHIIPLSSAQNEEELIKLNHYTNLQPLCGYVNRYVKMDRLDYKLI